jgi:exosome complex component RRP46
VQSLNSSQLPSQPLYVSSRAVAINAATLSVLNAGSIGIKGVPVAIGVAVVSKNGKGKQRSYYDDVPEDVQMHEEPEDDKEVTLILDPTRSEEQNAKARFCFGWAFGAGLSSGIPASDSMDQGEGRGRESEHDTEAECVYVESDGVFDAVTVSRSLSPIHQHHPSCVNPAFTDDTLLACSSKKHIMRRDSLVKP